MTANWAPGASDRPTSDPMSVLRGKTDALRALHRPGHPLLLPNVAPSFAFPAVLALSLVGCIAGTLLTPPDVEEVLERFYLRVRPWGVWKPVHERLLRTHPELVANTAFKRDMFNVAVGIVWQTALTATGIFIVLRDVRALAVSVSLVLVTAAILKLSWYDKLEDYPADLAVVDDVHRLPPEPEALAAAATTERGF